MTGRDIHREQDAREAMRGTGAFHKDGPKGPSGASPGPTEIRLRLFERGYCPLPLEGKNPEVNGKGWQQKRQHTNKQEIQLWASAFPYALNTGVLCRLTPFLDVDILSAAAARAVEDLVYERFEGHFVLTRFGMPPKRGIPFQAVAPFPKITVPLPLLSPNQRRDVRSWGEYESYLEGCSRKITL